MRAVAVVALGLAMALALAACATSRHQHPGFVEDNVARLENGMDRAEVEALFGAPDEVQSRTCGVAVGPPWPCEVWIYRLAGGYTNLFVFELDGTSVALNGWYLGHVHEGATARAGTERR